MEQDAQHAAMKAKQDALRLMRRGMNLAGEWRHADALAMYDRALALTPRGLMAKMIWELKGNLLRIMGNDAQADAAYAEAARARQGDGNSN
jgi:hypothetical protein